MTNNIEVIEEKGSEELERFIVERFREHALEATGFDGMIRPYSFVARENGKIIGALSMKTFWGGLHIRHLYLKKESRSRGVGSLLMQCALQKGEQLGCRFAFVETMNFQAVGFYQALGFHEEFARTGYDHGLSFHYLKKDL